MTLQSVKTWVTVPPNGIGGSFWVLVKITTHQMVEDTFERFFAGEDPHHIETLFRRVYSAGFTQRPDISMMAVFSGLEMAVWDILGKLHDQPVYQLIGGRFHGRPSATGQTCWSAHTAR